MGSRVARTAVVAAALASLLVGALPSAATQAPKLRVTQQLGMDTYFVYNCQSASLIEQWATTQFTAFRALGANSVGIGFPLYTNTINSNVVYGKLDCSSSPTTPYQTPPPWILGDVVHVAHKLGLKVLLRPLIDQENLYFQNSKWWRGALEPTNVATWFQNYLGTLRPYLLMARSDHVEHFAIETELDSLTHESGWAAAIKLTKAIYKGDLVWNYGWDASVKKVVQPGTSLGIDAYPKTSAPVNASIADLLLQWNHLLHRQVSYLIPDLSKVTFDEVGILAQDGAYTQPELGSMPVAQYPFDPAIQARWFTVACKFAKQHQTQGIYFWGSWLTTHGGALLSSPDPALPEFVQPATQQAVEACYTSKW